MDIDILGIDLAKRVFELHAADRAGSAFHRSRSTAKASWMLYAHCIQG